MADETPKDVDVVYEMSVVRQHESSLCMAAATAMVAKVSLRDVLSVVKLCYEENGKRKWVAGKEYLALKDPEIGKDWWCCDAECARFLAIKQLSYGFASGSAGKRLTGDEEQFRVTVSLDYPAIVCVDSRTIENGSHAVVWCPERRAVLDPQYDNPQLISGYFIQCWTPVISLENEE